jgi:putative two-component system response regulator
MHATILIIDDCAASRENLVTLLAHRGHRLLVADDGAAALGLTHRERPDLIITEILMPSMDGYEFVRQVRAIPRLAATPVIFLTATYLESEARALARDCGVQHLLIKPCEPEVVLRTVEAALGSPSLERPVPPSADFNQQHLRLLTNKLAQKVAELEYSQASLVKLVEALRKANEELAQSYDATLEGWTRALDMRDHETEGHTQRVTDLTVRLARAMGIGGDELTAIRRGALLHDIGKFAVPDSILLKPGPLDAAEWKLMRLHPVHARQLLEPIKFLRPALDIPCWHHEKWDGTGYPNGLKGKQIPLAARIFAVVDVWDALRSKRPYHDAWPDQRALEFILDQSSKHFDPEMVEHFMHLERPIAERAP